MTVSACYVSARRGALPLGAAVSRDWAMMSLQMLMVGISKAVIPTVGCRLYTLHVRATGYNLAHNIAEGLMGGLTPMAITAIKLSPAITQLGDSGSVWAAAVWLSAASVGTVIGSVGLLRACPQAEYTDGVSRRRSLNWPRCRSEINQEGLEINKVPVETCDIIHRGHTTTGFR